MANFEGEELVNLPVLPETPKLELADPGRKLTAVEMSALSVADQIRFVRFRGRPMVLRHEPYPHFEPLHKSEFDSLSYQVLGGMSRSRMSDVFAYMSNVAQDLTEFDKYILFGVENPTPGSPFYHPDAVTSVWDMEKLETLQPGVDVDPSSAIWRSPYGKIPNPTPGEDSPVPFIMSLAGGDQGLYDDIMQSLAPLVMARKPDGVIWWVGDGANGKSTLMDAIYKVFPGQLASITVKRLVDGRDTPSLNGNLANVVKESSEGRIDDTEVYKSIGTHENFRVHKFHSQDDMEIRGNLHHIFSGNSVPTFNDKGWSARRRTFIVPFLQRFQSDPTFEDDTFTPEMFGRLITEMCKYAKRIARQGYRYKWSATTLAAKAAYDVDANTAEEYGKYLIEQGIVAFDNFKILKLDYEDWCGDNGFVPLGITNLRRAVGHIGFERTSTTISGEVQMIYKLPHAKGTEIRPVGLGMMGMYTLPGFEPPPREEEDPKPEVPEFEPEPPAIEQLKGKW